MAPVIIIRPEAENDIYTAYNWYEQQHAGLGKEFALEFSASMDRILESPRIYSELYRGICYENAQPTPSRGSFTRILY
jgi:plasmid stabilization system protein ParE